MRVLLIMFSVYNIWNRGIQWCVSILAVATDLLITASIIFLKSSRDV